MVPDVDLRAIVPPITWVCMVGTYSRVNSITIRPSPQQSCLSVSRPRPLCCQTIVHCLSHHVEFRATSHARHCGKRSQRWTTRIYQASAVQVVARVLQPQILLHLVCTIVSDHECLADAESGDSYTQTGFNPNLTQPTPDNPFGNPAYP